jgi:hypothetical protein
MRLHYKIGESETVEYCDVISLYPYICKYFKFPIGHPVIHVGETCRNVESCLRMNGLIKCTVVPPKGLYHPVLSYRWNKKLLFCLFRSCVHDRNTSEKCHHLTDAERALEGTWVIAEVRLADEKGYKVHEIYEYQVTQYDPNTGQGGLFVEYINTLLKLKAEASGYPSWVRNPDNEDRYIEAFWQKDGVRLNKDAIKYNAAKRGLAKLCLKSMWGKFVQRPDKSQTKLISEPKELYSCMSPSGCRECKTGRGRWRDERHNIL